MSLDLLNCSIPIVTEQYKLAAIFTLAVIIPLSVITIVGNVLVMAAILKTKRIQSQSNILLGSLCLTDFTVGLIVQPIFAVRRLLELNGDAGSAYCVMQKIHIYFAYLSVGASITTLAIVSLDRWFAICRPFVYKQRQSKTLCLVVLVVDWTLIAILLFIPYIGLPSIAIYIGAAVVTVTSIFLIIVCYINIFVVILRHKKRITEDQTISHVEGSDMRNDRPAERKKTNTIAILIGTLFVFYVPHIVTICMKSYTKRDLIIQSRIAELIVLANSSVNPIIYCLRSTEIKTAIKALLKSAFARDQDSNSRSFLSKYWSCCMRSVN